MVKSRLATKKAGSRQVSSFHRYFLARFFSCPHSGHGFFVVVVVVVVAGTAPEEDSEGSEAAAAASAALRARYALILR
jgi:hypothetical protein